MLELMSMTLSLMPPCYGNGRQHIKLAMDGHITTSLLLIISKWL
jgi:hypothetical protein